MVILISSCLFIASRDFHLAHRDLGIPVGSWVAVEPNGTGLPSTTSPPRLGASLPSPRRGLPVGMLNLEGVYIHHVPKRPQTTSIHLIKGNSPSNIAL